MGLIHFYFSRKRQHQDSGQGNDDGESDSKAMTTL